MGSIVPTVGRKSNKNSCESGLWRWCIKIDNWMWIAVFHPDQTIATLLVGESSSKSPALLKPTTSKYVLDISWTGMCAALVWTIWRQRIDWRLSNLYRPCWPHCWFDRHLKIGQQSKINILTLFWFIFVSIAMYILPHCYWLWMYMDFKSVCPHCHHHTMFSLAARMGRMQTKSGKVWYFTKRQNTFPDFFVRASPTFCEVGKIWFASLKDRDASSMKQNSIGALTGPELCYHQDQHQSNHHTHKHHKA